MEVVQRGLKLASQTCTFSKPLNTVSGTRKISVYNSPKELIKRKVTLIPGDGIGPEITESVVGIFQAADVPIQWERFDETYTESTSEEYIKSLTGSIARNRVALKGPLYTPPTRNVTSRNLILRKSLDLFANVVPCKNIPGVKTRHSGTSIDLVVIRENTQGEYSGFEQEVAPGVVQCMKVVTDYASRRIAEYAFQYATQKGRGKVTAVHKANIQKQTDGLFLKVCREVSQKYPQIKYNEMIIDNCCMQLVMNPSQFDVMVTGNLYGNIIANVAAGLVGGPGIVGGANIGESLATFETGARHLAMDIAGQNKANPLGLLSGATTMLRYLDLPEYAEKIEGAVSAVIEEKILTQDIGGKSSTKEVTQAIIDAIAKHPKKNK
eukprot:TRINITY_DN11753_c0_g1_i1.p1 TRINITY_DN11753_c0_g1~~TRINITY_DN11753_c0_g1_i1.p1  ORF type:complete len:394 (-),score=127.43 TRINITY_DN11753_c0_g1_i1:17-1156(-)